MKQSIIFGLVLAGLTGCSTHRSGDCCSSAPVGQAGGAASGSAATAGRSRGADVKPQRKGETVTDLTQESRVLGVEAVVGGDAEIRR